MYIFTSFGIKEDQHSMTYLIKHLTYIVLLIFVPFSSCIQKDDQEVYMFSFFIENGEDGLHYAFSKDGYHWEALAENRSFLTPEVGEDKLMRDPCIIRGREGGFHMVWTVSWSEKGIGYANSPDLVNWSDQKHIPVMEHEPDARNAWAPEVFYDEKDDIYMIFWSSTIKGLFPETQSEEESGYNHRKYYVTTKDFEEFSETKLLYEPGFNVIDGTIKKVEDEYVMFIKDETIDPAQKNIRITRSKNLTEGYGPASPPITGDYWAEGPTVTQVGEEWIVYFDKYIEHEMGAVASTDLVHWTDISDQISFPKGTRHGTVFKVTQQEFLKLKESNSPSQQH